MTADDGSAVDGARPEGRHEPEGRGTGEGGGKPEGGGPRALRITRTVTIPLSEVGWRATTPGGPGGQHANRTASRVEVWFDVEASEALGPRQRARLLHRLGPIVRASAGEERSQARNRQLALERLSRRLAEGLKTETPRRPTRPTAGSQERRLQGKHRRAQVKRARRPPGQDE